MPLHSQPSEHSEIGHEPRKIGMTGRVADATCAWTCNKGAGNTKKAVWRAETTAQVDLKELIGIKDSELHEANNRTHLGPGVLLPRQLTHFPY
jgi:hypothetical protein